MTDDPQNPHGYPNLGSITVENCRVENCRHHRHETRLVCAGCGEVIEDSAAPCACYPEGFPPPGVAPTDRAR